jgi:hypothetical protein
LGPEEKIILAKIIFANEMQKKDKAKLAIKSGAIFTSGWICSTTLF